MSCNVVLMRLWTSILENQITENHVIAMRQLCILLHFVPKQQTSPKVNINWCFRFFIDDKKIMIMMELAWSAGIYVYLFANFLTYYRLKTCWLNISILMIFFSKILFTSENILQTWTWAPASILCKRKFYCKTD